MNPEQISAAIDVLSYLTLLTMAFGAVGLLTLVVTVLAPKKENVFCSVALVLSQNAISLIFLLSAVATLGSLFLSEIASFAPCKLCWYQRIFMYPTAIISGMALLLSDKKVFRYILVLSVIGALIAVYHYVIQMAPGLIQCSDEIASCSAKQFANFGFITIPFMSLVVFVNIIILSLFGLRTK